MTNLRLALALSLFIIHSPIDAASLNDQAEQAWQERASIGQTKNAIDAWQESIRNNPDQPEVWIRLTEAMGRMVRNSPKNEARKWAERARDTGKTSIEKNPKSAAAHAFYAEAQGQWANTHKGLFSLKAVKQAVRSLNTAVELDPKYGYAHMLLAEFYRKAPSTVSVGNKTKGLTHAKRAVDCEPDRAINHLAYANALIEQGQFTPAVEQLQFIVKMTPRPDLVPETLANQQDAKQILVCLEQNKGKTCAH